MSSFLRNIGIVGSLAVTLSTSVVLADDELATDYTSLGRKAEPAEIKAWDIDVRGDGLGLPQGQGTVSEGEEIYIEKCAACHGDFGEGDGRQPALMGGEGTLTNERPLKTVGSFWPYAGTLYDYIYRAMPFGDAQSLSVGETYSIVAYVLYLNNLWPEGVVLTTEGLTRVKLSNAAGFVPDARPETRGITPCMKACPADITITSRARGLDVTPD